MKQYMRCRRTRCEKILTNAMWDDNHSCECGDARFRGEFYSQLFPEEQLLADEGKLRWVDTDTPGPDPDVLNFENEKYWKRVRREVGKKEKNRRWRAAREKVN